MNLSNWIAPRWVHAIAISLVASGVSAQEVVTAPPAPAVTAPLLRDAGPPSQSRPAWLAGDLFQFGSVSLHPRLTLRAIYSEGLPAAGGQRINSMVYTFAPGLGVDLGTHWAFDYSPTWTSYASSALNSTLDHSASLSGAGVVQDWALQGSEHYGLSSPILYETGQQTKQTTWATSLGASRNFGSGLGFQTTESLNVRNGETFPDSRDWATMNWLTLQIAPRLQTGLGLGAGLSDIVGQPESTNYRYMGRLNWSPTDKVKLAVDGGVEVRHSRAAGAQDMHNPIIDASLAYLLLDGTEFTVSRSRSVANSYFQDQVTVNSSWRYGLSQRLLDHLFLSANYVQQHSDFQLLTTDSLPVRSDRSESFDFRLTTQLFKRWSLAASYARNKNRSSQSLFTFVTSQYGLEVSCRF